MVLTLLSVTAVLIDFRSQTHEFVYSCPQVVAERVLAESSDTLLERLGDEKQCELMSVGVKSLGSSGLIVTNEGGKTKLVVRVPLVDRGVDT